MVVISKNPFSIAYGAKMPLLQSCFFFFKCVTCTYITSRTINNSMNKCYYSFIHSTDETVHYNRILYVCGINNFHFFFLPCWSCRATKGNRPYMRSVEPHNQSILYSICCNLLHCMQKGPLYFK